MSNFNDSGNHCNKYANSQFNSVTNSDSLPPSLMYETNLRLSSISFTDRDILKTIKSLNVSRAHEYDDISIRMLKICDSEIVRPLSLIFKDCVYCGTLPNIWEKNKSSSRNLVPVHKKVINRKLKIIVQFLYYQFGEKYLKDY